MGRKTILLIAAVVVAALGAGLVFLYVQGVDQRAQADAAPQQVLTAVEQIEQGESVEDAQSAGKLELTEVPGSAILDGALSDTETIADTVALSPVFEGEQIVASRFGEVGSSARITIPDKHLAMSVELGDPERVAGFVSPGSRVALFATVGENCNSGPEATETRTQLLLSEVQVIGVGQTGMSAMTTKSAEGEETVEAIPTTILTVALEQADAEKLILAKQTTCLTMALLTDKSDVAGSPGTGMTDLFQES